MTSAPMSNSLYPSLRAVLPCILKTKTHVFLCTNSRVYMRKHSFHHILHYQSTETHRRGSLGELTCRQWWGFFAPPPRFEPTLSSRHLPWPSLPGHSRAPFGRRQPWDQRTPPCRPPAPSHSLLDDREDAARPHQTRWQTAAAARCLMMDATAWYIIDTTTYSLLVRLHHS